MIPEKLNGTVQENLITLLAHSDEHGKLVSTLIDPQLFEGEYRLIAERCVDYWKRWGQAPKQHMPDLLQDILQDPHSRRQAAIKRILVAMLRLSEVVNHRYVTEQLRLFARKQRIKDAILRSAEQLNAKQEMAIGEVEAIWNELLRVREIDFQPGIQLTDTEKLLQFLDTQYTEFRSGIPLLDNRWVVPSRETVVLLLAATGRGKTWGLIHYGKTALADRKRVLHISLEMAEEEVGLRYYQSIFGVPKREGHLKTTLLDVDGVGRLQGLSEVMADPDFHLSSELVRDELEVRMRHLGTRFDNLWIKRFPPRRLTIDGLQAYLNNLEVTQGFIPDMLILDYIGIMHTDQDNHRITLGRLFEDFRALCVERHMAGITAQQVSRIGAEARQVGETHVAEDWSLIGTAEQAITYTATATEARFGLGRLYVAKSRHEVGRFGILVTQNYQTGQFVLDSVALRDEYFEHLAELDKASQAQETEKDEDEDD